MATESPLFHDGSQTISVADYRNSTNTGTTHMGPSGSAQFQAVRLSTLVDRTVLLCTATGQPIYGILQNKPQLGEAADVGFFGVSKVICGATASITSGVKLMADSSGCMIAYSSAAGQASCGFAIETPSAPSAVFTAFIYGGAGPGSIA